MLSTLVFSHPLCKRKTIFILYPHTRMRYHRELILFLWGESLLLLWLTLFLFAFPRLRCAAWRGNTHHDPNRVHKYLDKDKHKISYMLVCSSLLLSCRFVLCFSSRQIRLNWMRLSFIEILFLCVSPSLYQPLQEGAQSKKVAMGNLFYFLIFYVIWIIKSFRKLCVCIWRLISRLCLKGIPRKMWIVGWEGESGNRRRQIIRNLFEAWYFPVEE